MKNKFVLTVIAASICLVACSTDREEEPAIIEKPLLTKITTTYYDSPDHPEVSINSLDYNSKGQLVSGSSAAQTSVFEYDSSGKPVKTIYYNSDKSYAYTNNYVYEGEKLVTINSVYDNPNYNRKVTYTYNASGQVSGLKSCEQPDCSSPITHTYTYSNQNISSETTVWNSTFSISTKREYTYDDKRNAYSTLNPYIRTMMGGAYTLSENNYKTEKISFKDTAGNWIVNQNITYTLQYNDENLPTVVTGKDENGQLYVEYRYEYRMQ